MLVLVLVAHGLVAVHIGAMATAGALLGHVPHLIRLGAGPQLFRTRGRVPLAVGLLPLGGWVQFAEGDDDPFVGGAGWKLSVIAAAGCAALIVVGLALGASLDGLLRAWSQLVEGALHPHDVGAPLIRRYLDRLALEPAAAVGSLALKVAAVNLLPLPSTNGGQLIAGIVRVLAPDRAPSRAPWLVIATVPILALGVGWILALARAL